jgi:hypothetical protein
MVRISTIGIVTANRPPVLRRLLKSLVRQCDAYGRRPRFLVVDGSHPSVRAATYAAVSEVAAASGHEVEYVGPLEASRFRANLGLDVAAIPSFAPGATGANRNLILLSTAGEQILSIDDDIVCATWALAHRADGLAVMGHRQELLETAFFDSRAKVFSTIGRTPADLLAAHERLLGQSLASLIAARPTPPDLTHSCDHLRSAVRDGAPLTVKATFTGLAGDAATYCPHLLLFSSGPLRAQLWSSQAAFATALTSRESFRIAATDVVTHDSACMAGCMGFSNRAVAPPFMPAGANEDGVFGGMLAACDRETLFAHVPFGVLHDSPRPSARGGRPMLSATQTRVSDLIVNFVRQRRSSGEGSPAERMAGISRLLTDHADLGDRAFADLVRGVTLDIRNRQLAAAEKAAADPACPDFWRAALRQYRDEFLRSATRSDFFLPIEFHETGSLESGYRALQGFLRNFGQLVAAWPELWSRARRLNSKRCAV